MQTSKQGTTNSQVSKQAGAQAAEEAAEQAAEQWCYTRTMHATYAVLHQSDTHMHKSF